MHSLGHATNYQILEILRQKFPNLSATTVHRITARLSERGELALAPQATDGSLRYDVNTEPHDHFMCSTCGKVRDFNIADKLMPFIQEALGNRELVGRLTITGSCANCNHI